MDKKKQHNTPEDATQAIDENTMKDPQAEMQKDTVAIAKSSRGDPTSKGQSSATIGGV